MFLKKIILPHTVGLTVGGSSWMQPQCPCWFGRVLRGVLTKWLAQALWRHTKEEQRSKMKLKWHVTGVSSPSHSCPFLTLQQKPSLQYGTLQAHVHSGKLKKHLLPGLWHPRDLSESLCMFVTSCSYCLLTAPLCTHGVLVCVTWSAAVG